MIVNNFRAEPINLSDIKVTAEGETLSIIEAIDGQLFTKWVTASPKVENGYTVSDVENDTLKIIVVNRYSLEKPAVGFIKGFGLRKGAIASSVAHDSHNVIAVGADDENLVEAVNSVIENQGGISVVSIEDDIREVLPLPIAGLMSNLSYEETANRYSSITELTRNLGSRLSSPFMMLSFMALLVIPEIKISDKGIFDGKKFSFI